MLLILWRDLKEYEGEKHQMEQTTSQAYTSHPSLGVIENTPWEHLNIVCAHRHMKILIGINMKIYYI
jgi:hypothetical protein